MTTINFKSAGVSARVINLTGPTAVQPVGIPAGVIGTSVKGPAFVPTTVATTQDFTVVFGAPADGAVNGPLAVGEWLRNQQAATFLRVLGVGQARRRETSGDNQGRVVGAGFVVGGRQPSTDGALVDNAYANTGGPEGRLYFLNAFMSEANSSGLLTSAGLSSDGVPLVRAVLMAASGVILRLSSSITGVVSTAPAASLLSTEATAAGTMLGAINLNGGRQEFVLFLNGHKGSDVLYPRVITASLDIEAPNYLGRVLNTDPLLMEKAGHVLYADWSVHSNLAVVTSSNAVSTFASGVNPSIAVGVEPAIFLATGSNARNSGSVVAPSFENFEDRFKTPKSPWIVSQKFGGKPKNLIRIHTLSDGAYENEQIKWSIENLTPSVSDAQPYGTFDLLVRRFGDTDKRREVTEAWRNLSLNPSSDNYVARVIGDTHVFYNFESAEGSQKITENGEYPNRSSLIRVEVSNLVDNQEVDDSALPMGFRGIPHLVTSGTTALAPLTSATAFDGIFSSSAEPAYNVVQMPVQFRDNLNIGSSAAQRPDKGLYWGIQFERKLTVAESNSTTEPERSIAAFTRYFPDFQTAWQSVLVSNNEGVADVSGSVLDADRFNNNLFTLENVRIVQTAAGLADTVSLVSWSYVRQGNITANSTWRPLASSDLTDASVRQVAKFSGIIQGGFDGVRIFDEDTSDITNKAITEEMNNSNRGTSDGPSVKSYATALEIMSDDTETDIQLLAIPGIRHPIITDNATLKTEDRFDAMYLMDIEEYDTLNAPFTGSSEQDLSVRFTANNHSARGLNSSFAAAYFPDLIVRDAFNNTIRQVPPSVAVLGAFALNDSIGFPWYAPAGFARGALQTTEEAFIPLNRDNMNALQDVKVNPLVSFAGSEGVVVWGQRTLLGKDSALERVNVRRLLISLRRQVRQVARRFIFEPGREETLARFSQLVNPIMKRVQDQKGVERFLVRIDTTTTTQTDVENRTIRGQIFLVPTKTLEFLSIDFVVTNQGNFVTSV